MVRPSGAHAYGASSRPTRPCPSRVGTVVGAERHAGNAAMATLVSAFGRRLAVSARSTDRHREEMRGVSRQARCEICGDAGSDRELPRSPAVGVHLMQSPRGRRTAVMRLSRGQRTSLIPPRARAAACAASASVVEPVGGGGCGCVRWRSVTRRSPVPSAATSQRSRKGMPASFHAESQHAAVGRPGRRRRRRADDARQRGDALHGQLRRRGDLPVYANRRRWPDWR